MEQKKNEIQVKDILLFFLLLIWIIIPNLKLIKPKSFIAGFYEYEYMQIVGFIGIVVSLITICKKVIECQDKKTLAKELLPLILLIGYMIWTFISCVFAKNKYNALYGDTYRREGFITYLIYAGFFLSTFSINSKKLRKYLLNIFILVAVTNTLLIYFINNNIEVGEIFIYKNIKTGVFYNQNHYGYYLLLATMITSLFFILEKKKIMKIFYAIAYIILLYFRIINNTLGCYLAFFITSLLFFVYCIYKRKYRLLCCISIMIFIVLSIFIKYDGKYIVYNNIKTFSKDVISIVNIEKQNIIKDETEKEIEKAGNGRIELWKYGIKIFLKNPILGYGPDNLKEEYREYNINQDRPHNLIIQLLTTSGIPGLTLYICSIGLIIIRGFKRLKNDNILYEVLVFTIIAYLISAMFGNSMYYTSPYFFILLGILYKEEIISF